MTKELHWKDFKRSEQDDVLRLLGDMIRLHRTAATNIAHAESNEPYSKLNLVREKIWARHRRVEALLEAAWRELKKATKRKP